jgi:hypothetical protein
MTSSQKRVVAQALVSLRHQYEWWLTLRHTSDSERQLATTTIELIDEAAADMGLVPLPGPANQYPQVYSNAMLCIAETTEVSR